MEVYELSYDPNADDDGDLIPNQRDKDFLDDVATKVCDSGADVFMACVNVDEAELLIAKWEALPCVPDAVWLSCAAKGDETRIGSDPRNYAAGGGQWFAAMPYSDEFFETTVALVDADHIFLARLRTDDIATRGIPAYPKAARSWLSDQGTLLQSSASSASSLMGRMTARGRGAATARSDWRRERTW